MIRIGSSNLYFWQLQVFCIHGVGYPDLCSECDFIHRLHGIPEWYGTEYPRTDSGQYLGIPRN